MHGAHDLGGKHGFGPIDKSQTENFIHEWEEKVFGLTLACGMLGQWNLDQSRFARERTDPAHYLSSTYYEHWLHGLELLLLEKGLVTEEELNNGKSEQASTLTAATPDKVKAIVNTGGPTQLVESTAKLFTLEQKVVVKNEQSKEHTRAPSYVKGVIGTIVKHHGAHIYADEHSRSGDKQAQHLYTVRFEAKDVWGSDTEGRSCIFADLFEPYLLSVEDYQRQFSEKQHG